LIGSNEGRAALDHRNALHERETNGQEAGNEISRPEGFALGARRSRRHRGPVHRRPRIIDGNVRPDRAGERESRTPADAGERRRRGAARRPSHGAAIPLNLGYSAGAGTYYGYTPGTYGGVGCYRGAYGVLVCPP
jgi:hypothetical protein